MEDLAAVNRNGRDPAHRHGHQLQRVELSIDPRKQDLHTASTIGCVDGHNRTRHAKRLDTDHGANHHGADDHGAGDDGGKRTDPNPRAPDSVPGQLDQSIVYRG